MITPEDLVRREVHYCASSLVSTLAAGYGLIGIGGDNAAQQYDVTNLCEQAAELAAPVDDWEEAAREADDIEEYRDEFGARCWRNSDGDSVAGDAQTACQFFDIDPYEREVYEHWIVSDWLADKLEAKGEKVDKDFAGLTIWARTTTGQAIYLDGVIEEIVADLNAA